MNGKATQESMAIPENGENVRKKTFTTQGTSTQVSDVDWDYEHRVENQMNSILHTSDQTNFLALIATYEATCALTVGMKFAATTNEVRLLSDPVTDASVKINLPGRDSRNWSKESVSSNADLS